MAKGWRYKSKIPQVIAAAREGAQKVVDSVAVDVLAESSRMVPQPGKSRGYAVGSLKASGYIVDDTGANWEAAVTAAQAAPDSRILKRDQIQTALDIPPLPPDKFMAIVDYPLTYAALIHNGFYHVRAKKHIIGVAFLESAVQKAGPELERLAAYWMGAQLMEIGFPTERELEARFNALEARRVRAEVRRNAPNFYDVMERSGEKLKRLRDPNGRIIETFGEMWERVKRNAAESTHENWG